MNDNVIIIMMYLEIRTEINIKELKINHLPILENPEGDEDISNTQNENSKVDIRDRVPIIVVI